MFFSFKTVRLLQVIHQPLYRPKQTSAGEYAVGRKIGLERVKLLCEELTVLFIFKLFSKRQEI
jgi:hypothetical protein